MQSINCLNVLRLGSAWTHWRGLDRPPTLAGDDVLSCRRAATMGMEVLSAMEQYNLHEDFLLFSSGNMSRINHI